MARPRLTEIVGLVIVLLFLRVCSRLTVSARPSHAAECERHIEFVVSFDHYAPLHELHERVDRHLRLTLGAHSKAWSLRERHVYGSTDFVLVAGCASLRGALADVQRVRAVSAQRRYERSETLSVEQKHLVTPSINGGCASIIDDLGIRALWAANATGAGIRIAIFDTGLDPAPNAFRRIALSIDYTHEPAADELGHGTFVSGVVAADPNVVNCPGVAPDAELYVFRVFTSSKVSYTTWFLDAFNHAMHLGIEILNLSIGGPDFEDQPFVDKVRELSANNIIVVSAVGNDGPHWGTVNNPADQPDVLAVGGLSSTGDLASFSSRGMTTWELPRGYGRAKPDLLAPAQDVCAPAPGSGEPVIMRFGVDGSSDAAADSRLSPLKGCRSMSGTSAAAPIVSGAIALLASSVPAGPQRNAILTPATMKLLLTSTTVRLPRLSVFEQGSGALNITAAFERLKSLQRSPLPEVALFPPELDLTQMGCPYSWPWCAQPLYARSQPTIFNLTIVNSVELAGRWTEAPRFELSKNSPSGILDVSFEKDPLLWPWSGYLGVRISVLPSASLFDGVVEGTILLSLSGVAVRVPVRVPVIPTPSRSNRLLWDQFHQLRFPSGYFPRDSLRVLRDPFDWLGDHPHTNFREAWEFLRSSGYFIEVLGESALCFDARQYAALLIVDSEDEWNPLEISKLQDDVNLRGLSLVVVGDWFDRSLFEEMRFFDENTRQWWTPLTGGANIPAVNSLLSNWGIAFGERVFDGRFSFTGPPSASAAANSMSRWALFGSGVAISEFPAEGRLVPADLVDFTSEILTGKRETVKVPILGFYSPKNSSTSAGGSGRITVFGDSTCLDGSGRGVPQNCLWLLRDMIRFATVGQLHESFSSLPPLPSPFKSRRYQTARDPEALSSAFVRHSRALHEEELICRSSSISKSQIGRETKDDPTVLQLSASGERGGVFRRGGTVRLHAPDRKPSKPLPTSATGIVDELGAASRDRTLRWIAVLLAAASVAVLGGLALLRWFRSKVL